MKECTFAYMQKFKENANMNMKQTPVRSKNPDICKMCSTWNSFIIPTETLDCMKKWRVQNYFNPLLLKCSTCSNFTHVADKYTHFYLHLQILNIVCNYNNLKK